MFKEKEEEEAVSCQSGTFQAVNASQTVAKHFVIWDVKSSYYFLGKHENVRGVIIAANAFWTLLPNSCQFLLLGLFALVYVSPQL